MGDNECCVGEIAFGEGLIAVVVAAVAAAAVAVVAANILLLLLLPPPRGTTDDRGAVVREVREPAPVTWGEVRACSREDKKCSVVSPNTTLSFPTEPTSVLKIGLSVG